MGRLLLLSAGFVMVSSPAWDVGDWGGASPRLETRLSSERVMPDLERLWLPLLLGGVESVDRAGRCRCGLGDRRSVINDKDVLQRGVQRHARRESGFVGGRRGAKEGRGLGQQQR